MQRFVDTITGAFDDAGDLPGEIKSRLPHVGLDDLRKAGVVAGAVIGLTAGSAGISALRRRQEPEDDS